MGDSWESFSDLSNLQYRNFFLRNSIEFDAKMSTCTSITWERHSWSCTPCWWSFLEGGLRFLVRWLATTFLLKYSVSKMESHYSQFAYFFGISDMNINRRLMPLDAAVSGRKRIFRVQTIL